MSDEVSSCSRNHSDTPDSLSSSDDEEGSSESESLSFINISTNTATKSDPFLIPSGNNLEPCEALQLFNCAFEARYGSTHPLFFIGSLSDAVIEAVSGSTFSGTRKPLVIYLHHDKSIISNIFCTQLLCNETVVNYLSFNCICWAWDITLSENRIRFLQMLTECFNDEAEQLVNTIPVESFPAILIVYKVEGSASIQKIIRDETNLDILMNSLVTAVDDHDFHINVEAIEEIQISEWNSSATLEECKLCSHETLVVTNRTKTSIPPCNPKVPGDCEHSFYFEKCSMEQFLSDQECPKSRIEINSLDDESVFDESGKIDLQDKLLLEKQQIILSFDEFILKLKRSLENLQIPLESIKESIISLEAFTDNVKVKVFDEEDRQKIEAAKSLSEVFIILHNYISFFNYRIIEHLINQHGAAGDRDLLKEYITKLQKFCEINICDIPRDIFTTNIRTTAKILSVQCIEQMSTLLGVDNVISGIARVFCFRSSTLQLCSVEKNCFELHLLISAAVADHIFPVSQFHQSALSKIGVKALTCLSAEEKGLD